MGKDWSDLLTWFSLQETPRGAKVVTVAEGSDTVLYWGCGIDDLRWDVESHTWVSLSGSVPEISVFTYVPSTADYEHPPAYATIDGCCGEAPIISELPTEESSIVTSPDKIKSLGTVCIEGYENEAREVAVEPKISVTVDPKLLSEATEDRVNHPSHYTSHPSGVECIEITEHHDFCVGNAIKYLWRAGLKVDADKGLVDKEIEDLNKAKWYIDRKINKLKKENGVK